MTATIDVLLRERGATNDHDHFVRFLGGDLTYGAADRWSDGVAVCLRELGVRPGATVAVLMPNRAEFVVTWFAVAKLGAITAPVNTAFRGRVLAHVLGLAAAPVIVVDATLCAVLATVVDELAALTTVIVVGTVADAAAAAAMLSNLTVVAFVELDTRRPLGERHVNAEHDVAIVLFTSGTTGRSKGCMLSHRYVVRQAELMIEHLRLERTDVLFCPFPLFHLDASVLTVVPALVLGATAALAPRFSASRFWDQIRGFEATVFDFMGATLALVHKQPRVDGDADNPARLGWGVPLPEYAGEFEARFGVRLVELYGSTDAGVPIYTPLDEPRRLGACGRAIAAYDVRLCDDDGSPVSPGTVGEIVVRGREPDLITRGYLGMPDETRAAFRDGWFLTGDLATVDDDGFFTFVGRRKDAIRRRGENISAFEVEEVVESHPAVLEAAAFGVASELSEQDVMIAVVARPGHTIDCAALIEFCAARMAAYMVPRYVDLVAALPKTPTEKVEKYLLVARGVSDTTWQGPDTR